MITACDRVWPRKTGILVSSIFLFQEPRGCSLRGFFRLRGDDVAANPRYSNGAARRKLRERIKALGMPCSICGGPIDYTLPAGHPMSFEVDEIIPVSRYREGGYASPQQCALDVGNCRAAHRLRVCNQRRGNDTKKGTAQQPLPHSRNWRLAD